MITQVPSVLPHKSNIVQKVDMLFLPSFNLEYARDLGALKANLQPFSEMRHETDKLHFVSCDDGEWQESMNSGESGHIGFGTKPLGMAPFFVESPQCGLGLEPTFTTQWAFTGLLDCSDRIEKVPCKSRKKLTHHKWMFFSGSDVLITFKHSPALYGLVASLLDQKRRITMGNKYQHPEFTGIVLTDDEGIEYDLYLKVYDVCGLLGAGGYNEAAQIAKVESFSADSKKLMDKYKTTMREGYIAEHEKWICYTLNDLNCLEIFEGAAALWNQICEDMDVAPITMHLTHGANVVALNQNIIAKKLGLDAYESLSKLGLFDPDKMTEKKGASPVTSMKGLLTMLNRQGSAEWLVTQNDDNKFILGAVDGGRCKNELPRRTRIVDVITGHKRTAIVVDTDIDGCYGNGLMNQLYPIGRATILSFTRSQTARPTLKDFISNKENKSKGIPKGLFSDLVSGLWYARFSTSEPLSFDQDLLISKLNLNPKSLAELQGHDSEAEMPQPGEGNDGVVGGEFVMLRRDLQCVTLTHDLLQVAKAVLSSKEWAEFTDKMTLDALTYYPRSCQVQTTDELIKAYKNEGAHETWLNDEQKTVRQDKRANAWMALDMGDGWVDKLAGLRKKYPKGSAENTFYKLIINCIYGVACSVFFPTFSNVVVANNITARARALAWMMAKSRRGQASITDGSMADLNACLYWRGSKPGMHTLANLDNLQSLSRQTRSRLEIAPLNLTVTETWEVGTPWEIKGYRTVKDKDGNDVLMTTLSNGSVEVEGSQNNWGAFDRAEWAHMKRFFGSGIDILDKQGKKAGWDSEKQETFVKPQDGLFAFEIKEMYASAAFQSQSNYYAVRADGKEVLKARGNNPKKVQYLDPFENEVYPGVPIKNVLKAIHDGLPIQPEPQVFTGTVIKVKAWKIGMKSKNPNAIKSRQLFPGQTTHKTSHIKPISISMFRFLTQDQYESWKKNHGKLRDIYGWGLEGFFVNADGTLDYDRAVNEIQDAIDAGKRFFKVTPEFPEHPMKSMKPEDIDWTV